MSRVIDYDRGVSIRQHKQTGIMVYMYKDTPGVYYNVHGTEVAEDFAGEAGFDIASLGKQRTLRERMSAAMDEIKAELDLAGEAGEVVKEQGGLKIVRINDDKFQVLDENGNKISPIPLPLDQATLLLDKLGKPSPFKAAAKKAQKEAQTE